MRALSVILGVLFCVVTPNISAGQSLQTIDVAVGEWKPQVGADLEGFGLSTQLVTVVLERMGYRPRYIFMPWPQAESQVRENEANTGVRATFMFLRTEEREKAFEISAKPIYETCFRFFYNEKKLSDDQKPVLERLADLSGFRIGCVQESPSYQYPKELRDTLRLARATRYPSEYELLAALIDEDEKAVQVVPLVDTVGDAMLSELFPESRFDVSHLEESTGGPQGSCLVDADFYFLMSKRNPANAELMVKFDEEYEQLDKMTLDRIKLKTKETPSLRRPEVVLTVATADGLIAGRDDDGQVFPVPRGTRGLLVSWPESAGVEGVEAKVRILTGPYRGRELIVDGANVQLR